MTTSRDDSLGNFRLYGTPVVLLLGLVGNVITVVVLHSKAYKCSPSWRLLLTFLSFTDTLNLAVGFLPLWVAQLKYGDFHLDYYTEQASVCKCLRFFTYFGSHVGPWTIVLLTIERVIAIAKPLSFHQLCTRKRMAIAWICILVIFAASDSTVTWLFEILLVSRLPRHDEDMNIFSNITNTSFPICILNPSKDDLWDIFLIFNMVAIILPFCFILVSDLYIISVLAKSKKRFSSSSTNNKLYSTSIMLLTTALAYLLLTTPYHIYITGINESYWANVTQDGSSRLFFMELIYTVLIFLYYINNSINLFLYSFSGVKFREAAYTVICCSSTILPQKTLNTVSREHAKKTTNNGPLQKENKANSSPILNPKTAIDTVEDNAGLESIGENADMTQL